MLPNLVVYFHRADVFDNQAGARPEAKRILIVITDGESWDDQYYPDAVREADLKQITRFAIGV